MDSGGKCSVLRQHVTYVPLCWQTPEKFKKPIPDNSIKKELEAADIILLCVSPDFLDVKKKYIWDIEVEKAMERHNKNGAIVIPIILRYCIWTNETFSKINALPRKGKPISSWMDKDEAWYNVANELELVINNLLSNKS